jgi:hypothetical protein
MDEDVEEGLILNAARAEPVQHREMVMRQRGRRPLIGADAPGNGPKDPVGRSPARSRFAVPPRPAALCRCRAQPSIASVFSARCTTCRPACWRNSGPPGTFLDRPRMQWRAAGAVPRKTGIGVASLLAPPGPAPIDPFQTRHGDLTMAIAFTRSPHRGNPLSHGHRGHSLRLGLLAAADPGKGSCGSDVGRVDQSIGGSLAAARFA